MSDIILPPSKMQGKQVFLDEQSRQKLKEAFGKDFDISINSDEDYSRAVFYFKCIGLKDDVEKLKEENLFLKGFRHYFLSKENMDKLYDCMHQDALKLEDLILSDDIESKEFRAVQEAYNATENDRLYGVYEDDGPNNNKKLTTCLKVSMLSTYLSVFRQNHPDQEEFLNLSQAAEIRLENVKSQVCKNNIIQTTTPQNPAEKNLLAEISQTKDFTH